MAEAKVNGVWLRSLGTHVGDVTWSTSHGYEGPCGPALASCTIDLPPGTDLALLRLGGVFDVYDDNGTHVFGGPLSEVARGVPHQLHAKGWARRYRQPAGRWGYDADGNSYVPSDPTTHEWLLDAGGLEIGVADDTLYTQVLATYVASLDAEGEPVTDTVTRDDAIAQGMYGVIVYELDLTPAGVMTPAVAGDYASTQLRALTIPGWLNRVSVDRQRLLTPGGHGADLQEVRAGQMVRLFNVPNNLGGLRSELNLDVILGEVEYVDGAEEVTLAPMNLAVRSLGDEVAARARAEAAAAAASVI